MSVTAALVKELRERTGLGMMECKKALVETGGDIDQAIDNLRKSGQAKAAKKAGRTAAEGAVVVKIAEDGKKGILLEVNSETDFVARDDNFLAFVDSVASAALDSGITDVTELMSYNGSALENTREALVQKIGENIQVRRVHAMSSESGLVGGYTHSQKIGVLVSLTAGDDELAKDVAMHVAATSPLVVTGDQVPEETIAKEKEIFTAQARESGKPEEIIEKMITGRISKFLKEVSLTDQAFVKNPDQTVGQLVKAAGAEVQNFVRFEVGEGIEKEVVDFAAEVAEQAGM